MGHPIYHLEVDAKTCRVEIRLNDFPVLSLTAETDTPANFAPPINPWLVGELNMLDVTLHPIVGASGASTFEDAYVWGNVRRFEKGDIVFPGSGDQITEITIPDELKEQVREEELELPVSFTLIFANEVIDFSDEMSGAPAFDDPAALTDYAIHLRDLALADDVDGLLAEHESKVQAWVRAYDEPEQVFRDSLRGELASFAAASIEPFERGDVELAPCCGGRIWEIRRAGALPLLRTQPDADGARTNFAIYAAPRDGALRIVR